MRILLVTSGATGLLAALDDALAQALRLEGHQVMVCDLASRLTYHRLAREELARKLGMPPASYPVQAAAWEDAAAVGRGFGAELLLHVGRAEGAAAAAASFPSVLWSFSREAEPEEQAFTRVHSAVRADHPRFLPGPVLPCYHPLAGQREKAWPAAALGDDPRFPADLPRIPTDVPPREENRRLNRVGLLLNGGPLWSALNAAAAGTAQAFADGSQALEYLAASEEALVLQPGGDWEDRLRYYAQKSERLLRVAARARSRVLREHTVAARLPSLLAPAERRQHPAAGPPPLSDIFDRIGAETRAPLVQDRDGPTLSVCLIARNEEDMLPGCLSSIRQIADQIVVVDTGSQDATAQIARLFGAEVYSVPWQDDFSAARNASLEHAWGEWILFLDADERLLPDDSAKLLELLAVTDADGVFLKLGNYADTENQRIVDSYWVFRLFRNHPRHRFTGRVHEQILLSIKNRKPDCKIINADVRLIHYGYMDSIVKSKDKIARNLRLLESEQEDTAFHHFNLGREYQRSNNYPMAVEHLRRSLELSRQSAQRDNFYPVLLVSLIENLNLLGRHREAELLLQEGLAELPDFPELHFLRADAALREGKPAEAAEAFLWCLAQPEDNPKYHFHSLDLTARSWSALGGLYTQASRLPQAVAAYRKALESNRLLTEPLLRLGELLLAHEPAEKVRAYLDALVDPQHLPSLVVLWRLFTRHHQWEIALDYARRMARADASPRPLLFQARSLLGSAAAEEAAAVLRQVPSSSRLREDAALLEEIASIRLGASPPLPTALKDAAWSWAMDTLKRILAGERPDPPSAESALENEMAVLQLGNLLLETNGPELFLALWNQLPAFPGETDRWKDNAVKLCLLNGFPDLAKGFADEKEEEDDRCSANAMSR